MKILLTKSRFPILIITFLLLFLNQVAAQLTITPGAQFTMAGNVQLTLSNTDLVNNGNLSAGVGAILFSGNTLSKITGSQNTTLYDLNIVKTAGSVQLQVPLAVSHQVIFTLGVLDLNGNNLNLGTTAVLSGEQESSHIIGPNGGTVIFNTTLNSPSFANPGNLGMLITSAQNLGNTTITRGHQSQTDNGTGSSILRYYSITPTNNTNVNATLRMQYFDAELNELDENALIFYKRTSSQPWASVGFDTRNITTDYVEKTGVSSLNLFTLSSINNALPVQFTLFNTHCNGNAVLLTWKTAQEQNSHYYNIERSTDATQWTVLADIPAAGNSNAEHDYSYADNTASGNNYYRIAEYDLDGKVQFTKILLAGCSSQQVFSIWPNPATDIVYINTTATAGSDAVVKLFDNKGALIKQQRVILFAGNNRLSLHIEGLSAGLYYVAMVSKNGKIQTQKVLKE